MNDTIWEELNFILNKFGKEEPDEHIKIKHICTKVLDCEEYESLIKKSLDNMFNIPNFDISDFSRLMLAIIEINKNIDCYKEVSVKRMKYILYSVLYSYLIKNQANFINMEGIAKIRMSFFNSIELMLIIPQTIKVNKQSCISCIGRVLGVDCLRGNRVFIE